MSYRDPKIITPPNYGEIFAKNMAYGAYAVRSAVEPIMTALEKQKKIKERMAASRSQYEQNIRQMITSKAGSFEQMFEEHLAKNGDAWYENEKLYANGKRSAKDYNDFKSNMTQELYDAAAASQNLNETITFIETNKMLLSGRNDHEIFGLKEALENPNEFNLQLTRNEEGKTIFKYKAEDGKDVIYDYDKLRSVNSKEDIILQNDMTVNGEFGKAMTTMHTAALNNTPLETEIDSSKFEINKAGNTKTTYLQSILLNKDAVRTAHIDYLAQNPNTFTTNQIESHYLDSMCKEDYEGCVKRKAGIAASTYNIIDTEELAQMLLTPFKEDQIIKNANGEEINVSKIAYAIAEQDIIDETIKRTKLRGYFEGDGRINHGTKIDPITPTAADLRRFEEANERNDELDTLFKKSFTFLGNAGEANVLATANELKGKPPREIPLSASYKITMEDQKALADYLFPMGFELKQTTKKIEDPDNPGQMVTISGPERKTDSNGNSYYIMETNKDAVGAVISKTAKQEFRINGDTTVFDLLSYRMQLQDVNIDPNKLYEKYEQGEEEYIAYLSAQFMGGSYKGYKYNPND